MKYHGLRDETEIKQDEFDKWIDVISRKYINEKCGTIPDKEYDDMIEIIDGYCEEKRCEPTDIDYSNSTNGFKSRRCQYLQE